MAVHPSWRLCGLLLLKERCSRRMRRAGDRMPGVVRSSPGHVGGTCPRWHMQGAIDHLLSAGSPCSGHRNVCLQSTFPAAHLRRRVVGCRHGATRRCCRHNSGPLPWGNNVRCTLLRHGHTSAGCLSGSWWLWQPNWKCRVLVAVAHPSYDHERDVSSEAMLETLLRC